MKKSKRRRNIQASRLGTKLSLFEEQEESKEWNHKMTVTTDGHK